jgi:GT2 family glycosyltransferase
VANPPSTISGIGRSSDGVAYDQARLLIRCQAEAIGMITVDLVDGAVDMAAVQREVQQRFGDQLRAMLGPERATAPFGPQTEPLPPLSPELVNVAEGPLPPITVVIGTRDRAEQVVECVELVLKQDYPSPIEVIIVDNGATSSATADAVSVAFGTEDRVRYVAEPSPGLSRARNIGLALAAHPITVFLSDDIRVDSMWLLAVARGFGRSGDVRCVTGFCPPLYLDTEEQLRFESSMAWGTRQGFEPVLFAYESADDPLHPYRPGRFANGSNMAFDTETFRSLGGFDEALGPGTKARGGEDLDAPIRILADGGLVAYEPAVIGWHADTYADRSFSTHMFTYGLGLTAFLTKHLIDGRSRRAVLSRITLGLPNLLRAFVARDETLSPGVSMPVKFHLWQLGGRIAGPFAYLASRRTLRH